MDQLAWPKVVPPHTAWDLVTWMGGLRTCFIKLCGQLLFGLGWVRGISLSVHVYLPENFPHVLSLVPASADTWHMSELGAVLWWWYFKFCKSETKLILRLQIIDHSIGIKTNKSPQHAVPSKRVWEFHHYTSTIHTVLFIRFTPGSHSRLVSAERVGLTTRKCIVAGWWTSGLPRAVTCSTAVRAVYLFGSSH